MANKKYNGKYENMSPFKRFLHKNTGFLVMGGSVIIITTLWFTTTEEQEFFMSWNCDKLNFYINDQTIFGYTDHNDLSEELHLKLHLIYNSDCSEL